jgi:imidazoleglycerol-phosphate dehydratase
MEETRVAKKNRKTAETEISLELSLDGGAVAIETGIPFFDHMLDLFAHHGCLGLQVQAKGDLEVDYHHLVEDTGIVLGEAVREALGNKAGIRRYGFFLLPMDECLCRCVLDFGNRSFLHYEVKAVPAYVRDFNIHLFREFYQAFANAAGANVHMQLLYGDEPHHVAEAVFKAFGRAFAEAVAADPRRDGQIPSTTGQLD